MIQRRHSLVILSALTILFTTFPGTLKAESNKENKSPILAAIVDQSIQSQSNSYFDPLEKDIEKSPLGSLKGISFYDKRPTSSGFERVQFRGGVTEFSKKAAAGVEMILIW